jgi:hypothetical protein
MATVKQRKNIVTNIIRQAAGEMQLRINLHSVDTHPEVRMGAALIFQAGGQLLGFQVAVRV